MKFFRQRFRGFIISYGAYGESFWRSAWYCGGLNILGDLADRAWEGIEDDGDQGPGDRPGPGVPDLGDLVRARHHEVRVVDDVSLPPDSKPAGTDR